MVDVFAENTDKVTSVPLVKYKNTPTMGFLNLKKKQFFLFVNNKKNTSILIVDS